MRSIDQIGASFEDEQEKNYKYSYLHDTAPQKKSPDQYIETYAKGRNGKPVKYQAMRKNDSVNTHVELPQRKPSKPIQKNALVFDLQIETLEPGRSFPSRSQIILLIHKAEVFDLSVLTKEQYRLYQIGLLNRRLMFYAETAPEAQNMLKQHVTKKTFGYETETKRHLITIRSWK